MSRRRHEYPAELRDRDRQVRPLSVTRSDFPGGVVDLGPGSVVHVSGPAVLSTAHYRASVQVLVAAMFTYGVAVGLFAAGALMWAAVALWLLATALMLCLALRVSVQRSFERSTGHNPNDGRGTGAWR